MLFSHVLAWIFLENSINRDKKALKNHTIKGTRNNFFSHQINYKKRKYFFEKIRFLQIMSSIIFCILYYTGLQLCFLEKGVAGHSPRCSQANQVFEIESSSFFMEKNNAECSEL